jgi:Uma2 family endonuclease
MHDNQSTTNPIIAFEVLSPSSEGDDEGDKRTDFQSLPALQAYVLVAQDERRVRVFRRAAPGARRGEADIFRDGDRFELPMLTSSIAVAEVYDSILDKKGRSLLR